MKALFVFGFAFALGTMLGRWMLAHLAGLVEETEVHLDDLTAEEWAEWYGDEA